MRSRVWELLQEDLLVTILISILTESGNATSPYARVCCLDGLVSVSAKSVAPRRFYLHLHVKVVGSHLSSKMPSTGQEECNIDTTKRVVDGCHQESVSGKEETLCRETKQNVCERSRECCQCLGVLSTSPTNASNQAYRCRQGRILRQGNLFGRTVQFKKGRSRNHPFRPSKTRKQISS